MLIVLDEARDAEMIPPLTPAQQAWIDQWAYYTSEPFTIRWPDPVVRPLPWGETFNARSDEVLGGE